MQERTPLIIAHRLATVKILNRIVVFEAGKLIEQGIHDCKTTRPSVAAQIDRPD